MKQFTVKKLSSGKPGVRGMANNIAAATVYKCVKRKKAY